MQRPFPSGEPLPGLRRFPWRFAVYIVILLYLAGDLYLFKGPLRRRIDTIRGRDASAEELAREEGIVATVNAHPIRREELDRAVAEYCLRRGLKVEDLPRERHNAIRVLLLDQLVVDRLIWFHSHHTPVELSAEEIKEAKVRFRRGFASEDEFEQAAAAQGFSVERLDAFLENQAMQRAWIERVIAPHITVSEDEVRLRFEADTAASQIPERLRARQVFLATLDKDPAAVKEVIAAVAQRLEGGEDFAALALELSEDERSKRSGGDLGWFGRERVPEDFGKQVFAQEAGAVGQPFATELGWHLVEVTEKAPARVATLDEMREEIRATIETEKRAVAVDALVAHVKRKSKNATRYSRDFIWVE